MLVQCLRENHEHQARRLEQLRTRRLGPRLLRERRMYRGQYAHEHQEAVHLPEDVLRARVLDHDAMNLH